MKRGHPNDNIKTHKTTFNHFKALQPLLTTKKKHFQAHTTTFNHIKPLLNTSYHF